jgi:hypothetical protein
MKDSHGSLHAAFAGMMIYERAEIATQVDKMRADIQRCGESHVGCPELKLLCPEISAKEEKNGVEQIAEWERWTFEYLADGSVRFSPLPADIAVSSVSFVQQSSLDVKEAAPLSANRHGVARQVNGENASRAGQVADAEGSLVRFDAAARDG